MSYLTQNFSHLYSKAVRLPMNFFKIEEGVNAVLKLNWQISRLRSTVPPDGTGNSRNGSYQRTIVTSYGKITVDVPRDRNGAFQSPLLPPRKTTC